MMGLLSRARRLSSLEVALWINGERGSGRSVLARAVHRDSHRAGRPLLRVPCASLGDALLRELAGDRRETPVGAASTVGLVQRADGGTVLFEDVDDAPPEGLAFVLQLLRENTVTPVGDSRPVPVDVRVVLTSDRSSLREPHFAELPRAVLDLPPLRDRPEDVAVLAERHLESLGERRRFGGGVVEALRAHRWPGNVRELRDAVEFARSLAEGDAIELEDLPRAVREPGAAPGLLEQGALAVHRDACERSAIVLALVATGDAEDAARVLGMSHGALLHAMARHRVALPQEGTSG
jgi:DNA-binding NtrC family response regulator